MGKPVESFFYLLSTGSMNMVETYKSLKIPESVYKELFEVQLELSKKLGKSATLGETIKFLIEKKSEIRISREIRDNRGYLNDLREFAESVNQSDYIVCIVRRFSSIRDPEVRGYIEKIAGMPSTKFEIFISDAATAEVVRILGEIERKYRNAIIYWVNEEDFDRIIAKDSRYLFVLNRAEIYVAGEEAGQRKGWYYQGWSPDYDTETVRRLRAARTEILRFGEAEDSTSERLQNPGLRTPWSRR